MSRIATRLLQRGQATVEFALVLPILIVLLFGMLEFGSAYDHQTAMAYAVREGARVGASLGNGGTNSGIVDPTIVAAVQRGLTNPILIDNVTAIEIYQSNTSGQPITGKINRYDRNGTLIGTAGWPANTRVASLTGDSIGVRVYYDFEPTTPAGVIMDFLGGGVTMTDSTVMKLEPTL